MRSAWKSKDANVRGSLKKERLHLLFVHKAKTFISYCSSHRFEPDFRLYDRVPSHHLHGTLNDMGDAGVLAVDVFLEQLSKLKEVQSARKQVCGVCASVKNIFGLWLTLVYDGVLCVFTTHGDFVEV